MNIFFLNNIKNLFYIKLITLTHFEISTHSKQQIKERKKETIENEFLVHF